VQLDYIRPVIARHIANGKYFDAALPRHTRDRAVRLGCGGRALLLVLYRAGERRDELARRLSALGIGNSLAHKRNDRHSVFAASRCDLPKLDHFYGSMLHIPCGWWVGDAERERIADALRPRLVAVERRERTEATR